MEFYFFPLFPIISDNTLNEIHVHIHASQFKKNTLVSLLSPHRFGVKWNTDR